LHKPVSVTAIAPDELFQNLNKGRCTLVSDSPSNKPARSHPLAPHRTLYDKTALYYAHGTLYR